MEISVKGRTGRDGVLGKAGKAAAFRCARFWKSACANQSSPATGKCIRPGAKPAAFFAQFAPRVAGAEHAEVVICPPFVNVAIAVESAKSTRIEIGAQDVFWLNEGAYTGEVSAPMLAAAGCRWVIVGHSERRHYFSETEETVFKRTVAALDAGLKAIV